MSLWKLLNARWGLGAGETAEVRMDQTTNALISILHPHHEVHAGRMFTCEHNVEDGSGAKATISFTTPDTAQWAHVVITVRSNVEAHYTLGEGATITADSGDDYVPRHMNRNKNGIGSSLISAGSAGGADNVTLGGTVTNFGLILETIHFGSSKIGGEGRGTREWVLKQNTTYACEIEAEGSSADITIELHWYEHVDIS